MVDFALIIPCYNEQDRIESTIKALVDFFCSDPTLQYQRVVIVPVNDGSTDATQEAIQRTCAIASDAIEIKPVFFNKNHGKGFAIRAGVASVEARAYGFIDADLSYDPSMIPAALKALQDADMVIGERSHALRQQSYPWGRSISSRVFSAVTRSLTGLPFVDTQCGFKFFRGSLREEVLRLTQCRYAFDVELLLYAMNNVRTIRVLPVHFIHRQHSRVTFTDGMRFFFDVLSLYDRMDRGVSTRLLAIMGLSVGVITVALFGWTVAGSFFFSDDFTLLWHGTKVGGSISNILTFHISTFYSPVMNALLWALGTLFGMASAPWFIVGILLQILMSLMAGVLTVVLTRSSVAGFVAAVVAATAGSAYEPLVWMGAQMHIIVSIMILIAMFGFAEAVTRARPRYLMVSFLGMTLALATKEIAAILPVLLVLTAVFLYFQGRWKIARRPAALYTFAVFVLWVAYLFQQWQWQRQSVWIEQGIWSLDPVLLLRVPLTLVDMLVPLRWLITSTNALPVLLGTIGLTGAAFVAFRSIPAAWFGMGWALIAMLPTTFFRSSGWWELHASRYTTLPRLGLLIALGSVVATIVRQDRRHFTLPLIVRFILLSVILQTIVMIATVRQEYDYVYRTGRTLVEAAHTVRSVGAQSVAVVGDRPFQGNTAHIVAVFDLIAGLDEQQIAFVPDQSQYRSKQGQAILAWDPWRRAYIVSYHDGVESPLSVP